MNTTARATAGSISRNLDTHRWGDDVSREELSENSQLLDTLSPEDTNAVIESLSDEQLGRWMDEAYESNIPGFQSGGLDAGERQDLFNNFARDLSAHQLHRVHDALGQNERQAELSRAIDTHAPAAVSSDFLDRTAATDVADNIAGGLSNSELKKIRATLERLSPEQANTLFESLSDEQLQTLASELHDTGIFSNDGLNETERRDLYDTMSGKLAGEQLFRFSAALGAERSGEFAEQIAASASVSTRNDFIRESLAAEAEGDRTTFNLGSQTTEHANSHHRNAATVTASLRSDDANDLFASLNASDRQNLFTAAANSTTSYIQGYGSTYVPAQALNDVDTESFNALLDSAASVTDTRLRAALMGEAAGTLHTLNADSAIPAHDSRGIANHIVDSIDGATLAQLSPDANVALATALTADGQIATEAVNTLGGLSSSESRDTLIRTVFSKVPDTAYTANADLAPIMARAMVSTTGSQLSADQQTTATTALTAQLQTEGGRSLLANPDVNPTARLWAAEQVMAQPEVMASALGDANSAWETPAVLEMFGQARMDQFALAQTDRAVPVSGFNIDNLVGSSVGAQVRTDVPADLDSIGKEIDAGEYNFFEGNKAVSDVADGIRAAQSDLGGGPISIATVPVQFSSEQSGPIDLTVYRVESESGSRIVDSVGRTYANVVEWVQGNALPPGQVSYPSGLTLGDGSTPVSLETSVTPSVRDTTIERIKHWGDLAALGLGAVASGVIVFGSGGLATPVVAGAWAVAGGSALWATGRGVETIIDRASHDQSVSLADPDARAAWLTVAAGGLTLAGGGLMGTAARATNGSRLAVSTARAAGVLNTGANYADAATALNDVHTLYSQWDTLSPGQRAQTALSVAFWGGMTGVSVRMGNGSVGDLSFADNINRAMIETGARVQPNAELNVGTARVVRGEGNQVHVEHHPSAPDYVIRAHQDAAHQLLSNGNTGGALQRMFGATDAYPPGSFGEATAVEVVKHNDMIASLQSQIDNGDIRDANLPGARQTLADYQFELNSYRADLAHIRANPEAGFADGPGSVDVKRSNAYRVGAGEDSLTLTAAARLPFDNIATPSLREQFPNATRIGLDDLNADLSLTLSDGSTITKTGENGNRLVQILRPVEDGGWGGALFHDAATDTLIVSVNMRETGAESRLDRVEVSFSRNADNEWRIDFGEHAVYSTSIDPRLTRERGLHFREANKILSEDLSNNPQLADNLALSPLERQIIDLGQRTSPAPYTWHHVNGDGDMQLVNEGIHAFFNHSGGYSEWQPQ